MFIIMQSNIFNQLRSPINSTSKSFVFKDIDLDFSMSNNDADIKVSKDGNAVRNSLRNLLNTRPGQNFLFPTFGLNLSDNLFEPMSEFKGNILGESILRTINRFEPRVSVESIDIGVDIDNNEYAITIRLFIPSISIFINTDLVLNEDGTFT